jgi:hypothetical protein
MVLQKKIASATTQPFAVDAVHFFDLKIVKGAQNFAWCINHTISKA